MFSKHEETVMYDLANLLNQARSMGLAAGEIDTVADLMEERVYESEDVHRNVSEVEARDAVAYISRVSKHENLIDVSNALEWVCDVQ